nr:Chain B, cell death protein GRIM [synthetic construct]1SE0_B Chain B, Cell death protein Grim [synthetic construct]
AIAYFIPDQA